MSAEAKGLANLPDELLQGIFANFDKPSFYSLCKVSRKLHDKSIHWLYTDVNLDLRDRKTLGSQPHNSVLLLRTLLHNPRLAMSMSHIAVAVEEAPLSLAPWPEDIDDTWLTVWNPERCDQRQQDFTQDVVKPLRSLWMHHSVRFATQEYWFSLLDAGRIEAVIACIIQVSTNLQSLRLGSRVWRSKITDRLLEPTFSWRLHGSLRSVDLCPDIQSRPDVYFHEGTYQCIYPILQLPNMVCFSAPLPAFYSRPPMMLASRGSFLQTLSLKRTRLSEEMLGFILQSTQLLKSLTYWSCYDRDCPRWDRVPFVHYLDCDRLGRSLLYVKKTLVELSLAFDMFSYSRDINGVGLDVSLGSLSILNEFQQLTTVMAPYLVLLGWSKEGSTPTLLSDILPSSIRKFTLTDDLCLIGETDWCNTDIVQQLKYLQDRISRSQVSKENFNLTMHVRHPWPYNKDLRIGQLCVDHGVSCQVLEPEADDAGSSLLPTVVRRRSNEFQRIHGAQTRRHHASRGRIARGAIHRGGRGVPRGVLRGRGMHE